MRNHQCVKILNEEEINLKIGQLILSLGILTPKLLSNDQEGEKEGE